MTAAFQSEANNAWQIVFGGTLNNGTTASIDPHYVAVQVLGSNGDLLDDPHVSAGDSPIAAGRSAPLSGSDTVSSAGRPQLGQISMNWSVAGGVPPGCHPTS
ncbi:MAG: hypothetical protein ACRD6W_12330 [Nitrososphaerales archaeon]